MSFATEFGPTAMQLMKREKAKKKIDPKFEAQYAPGGKLGIFAFTLQQLDQAKRQTFVLADAIHLVSLIRDTMQNTKLFANNVYKLIMRLVNKNNPPPASDFISQQDYKDIQNELSTKYGVLTPFQ